MNSNWGKFFITSVIVGLVIWGLAFLSFGNFYLEGNLIPTDGIEPDFWVIRYDKLGAICVIAGVIPAIMWNNIGLKFDGSKGIGNWYNGFAALALLFGFIIWGIFNFVIMWLEVLEGGMLPKIIVVLTPLIVYWLITFFASPAKVKNIPWGK